MIEIIYKYLYIIIIVEVEIIEEKVKPAPIKKGKDSVKKSAQIDDLIMYDDHLSQQTIRFYRARGS